MNIALDAARNPNTLRSQLHANILKIDFTVCGDQEKVSPLFEAKSMRRNLQDIFLSQVSWYAVMRRDAILSIELEILVLNYYGNTLVILLNMIFALLKYI